MGRRQEVLRRGVERLSAFLIWGCVEVRGDCDSSFTSLIFPFLPHYLTLGLLIRLIDIMLQNWPRHLNPWSVGLVIDIIYIHAPITLCGGLKENVPQLICLNAWSHWWNCLGRLGVTCWGRCVTEGEFWGLPGVFSASWLYFLRWEH